MITEAFRTVKSFDPWVANGHYDLFTAKNETILPKVWHAIVEPGAAITMRMRPRPDDFPITEAAPLSTISEQHNEDSEKNLMDNMAHVDTSKDHSTLDAVDDMEVKKVVEELLRRYTLPLFT